VFAGAVTAACRIRTTEWGDEALITAPSAV